VRGLMNIQFAIKEDMVYVLEVNPRASRTIPYVSKATGVPLARLAAHVITGRTLDDLGFTDEPRIDGFFVKEVVLPFRKFLGVDAVLGPEMRSTGEVMGISTQFPIAFAKSQLAAGSKLPTAGRVFVSVSDTHKDRVVPIAKRLWEMDYELLATAGTAERLDRAGIPTERIKKLVQGNPNLIDHLKNGTVDLIINTPSGKGARTDEGRIRAAAVQKGVPCITTLQAAEAAIGAMQALRDTEMDVQPMQERFPMCGNFAETAKD
jgi:carbamoyl-phosphate synthase large subunit